MMSYANPSPCRAGTASQCGAAIPRALLLLAVVCAAIWGGYRYLHARAEMEQSKENLRLIYMALEMYEIDRGSLPDLAFFPDDARLDNDSLLVVLSRYGVNEKMAVCSAMPRRIQELGLNYLWNVKLNGKKLHEPGERTWMLVEMNALSDRVPPPHLGRYNILYTDGKVESSPTPPPGLRLP